MDPTIQDFTIKNAGIADLPVIAELAARIWPGTYHFLPEGQVDFMLAKLYSSEALTDQMQAQNQKFILLLTGSTPIGFAGYTIDQAQKSAKLNKLYILQQWHGKGLGKYLINSVQDKARLAGCHELYLNVNRHNPACGFYSQLGFSLVREVDIAIGPYFMNDFILKKQI